MRDGSGMAISFSAPSSFTLCVLKVKHAREHLELKLLRRTLFIFVLSGGTG
jgi:hypothetical protein